MKRKATGETREQRPRTRTSPAGLTAWLAAGLAALSIAARVSSQAPGATAGELRYVYFLGGHRVGTAATRGPGRDGGERIDTLEFNDRGRGARLESRAQLDAKGLPVALSVSGVDYMKNPVAEQFIRRDGRASWRSSGESGERRRGSSAFYLPFAALPQHRGLLVSALLANRGRLDLLPQGEARLEELSSVEAPAPGFTRTVRLYALTGLGFDPEYVWLDTHGSLFAIHSQWDDLVLEGWEGALAVLSKAQDQVTEARAKATAARLSHRPSHGFALRGVKLFDPESGQSRAGMTVLVNGDRIAKVGPDPEVALPPGAEVVEAGGRTLLPGLWDMHVHLSSRDGIRHLACGVTSVRDMANDIDGLTAMRKRFDTGEELGPRVLRGGFIDGPGPYAGPSKVLVATEQEALAAVDRYIDLGYDQIKLYSSLDPALVPPIIARAHQRGLRVSGHIPNGLTAEAAVRAGFDEIQHVNFLFLNFISGVDTRTPARFSAVAEHAAELDLTSPPVRSFLQLLRDSHTAIDPTLGVFERMFTTRPGEIDPAMAAVATRLPPLVRREWKIGGLPIPQGAEGPATASRYRASFGALLAMVRALRDEGITIEAGTDGNSGFGLQHELELYVAAGIPAPEVLRIATLGAARVMKRDRDLGTIAPGKLADLVLVDGDPAARIADIRRVALTVKGGTVYDPAALCKEIGVEPAVASQLPHPAAAALSTEAER